MTLVAKNADNVHAGNTIYIAGARFLFCLVFKMADINRRRQIKEFAPESSSLEDPFEEDDSKEHTRLVAKPEKDGFRSSNDRMGEANTMELVVFLRDRTGLHMAVEEGQMAEASDLTEIVIEEQGLPPETEEVFAIWLVSPLLELRLKKHHKPFHLVQQWDELCGIYTDARPKEIERDEPVVMFQRNVFYPKEKEMELNNEQILCLLYHEAKYNVIEEHYILTDNEYDTLAGIQALIHLGKYNRGHVLSSYRADIHKFYPEHQYKPNTAMTWFGKSTQEPHGPCDERLLRAHQQISREFENTNVEKYLTDLYKRYLKVLWKYPFYGSTIFQCHIIKPPTRFHFLRTKVLRNPQHLQCFAAINTEGLCLIDREKDEVILTVPFTQMSWHYQAAEFDVDDDTQPCLYLQFLVNTGSSEQVTKLLQIFSRQAKLMDALIESCVKRKLQMRQNNHNAALDMTDGPGDFSGKLIQKLDKLTLQTYSKSGEKLD